MKKKLLLITLIILIITMYYKNYFLEMEDFTSFKDISNNVGTATNALETPKENLEPMITDVLPGITDSINKIL